MRKTLAIILIGAVLFGLAGCVRSEAAKILPPDETEQTDTTNEKLTAQTANEPVYTYCGNTQSTLYIDGEAYTFGFGHSVTLTDILRNLDYNPYEVCRCMPQYRADTEFGTNYHIHLEYGFVRCDKGQAKLTREQIDAIREIVNWAKATNCQYQEGDSQ